MNKMCSEERQKICSDKNNKPEMFKRKIRQQALGKNKYFDNQPT